MAFWRRKSADLEQMYRVVQRRPGISLRALARELGVQPSTVQRRLPSLEEAGYLLWEDDRGRLWPFDERSGRVKSR